MAKQKKVPAEETKPENDLAAFEEWEKSEGGGVLTDEFDPAREDILGMDDLAPQPDAPQKRTAVPEDEPDSKPVGKDFSDELAELAPDVPVNLVAVIGKTRTNVGELLKIRIGKVIALGRAPGETVDLVANNRLIARGELVEMDGKLGVRILKMVR